MSSKKREIRQLWIVAKHYLELAEVKIEPINPGITSGDLAKHFDEKIIKEDVIETLMFAAHLSSCAIRLWTINEITSFSFTATREPSGKYRNGQNPQEWFRTNLKTNIHQMLRNNIGHEENKNADAWWQERQKVIEGLKIYEIFELLRDIKNDYENKLKKEYGIL